MDIRDAAEQVGEYFYFNKKEQTSAWEPPSFLKGAQMYADDERGAVAATKIQGLFRTKLARRRVRSLIDSTCVDARYVGRTSVSLRRSVSTALRAPRAR
jgi:hypothetical protein